MAFSAVLLFSVVSIAIPIPSAEAAKSTTITLRGGHGCKLIGGDWQRNSSTCKITNSFTPTSNIRLAGKFVLYISDTLYTSNFDLIIDQGSTLLIDSGATINNNAVIINYGTINNEGTINRDVVSSIIRNYGVINNYGTIANSNYGEIDNYSGAQIFNINGSTINNSGTINNISGGTINNNSGATITNNQTIKIGRAHV